MTNFDQLEKLCKLVRYDILISTTTAGSGHPTSSLSAVELMTTLFFSGFYHYDLKNPKSLENDKLIFSKGHASPLLYSLYHVAHAIEYKELLTLRKFGSPLQGHPTPNFPYVEVATGSLGQGLSVGVGMALGLRLKTKINPKIWVLMGDSEMAEGQVWEAMEIASFYKLNNVVGIIDVNRLGQQGETEEGWDLHDYKKKVEAFGWNAIVVNDGHDLNEVYNAFKKAFSVLHNNSKPTMIIAKTIKGKGISFLENKNGWHGKALNQEELKKALKELGKVDSKIRGKIEKPDNKLEYYDLKLNSLLSKINTITAGDEKKGVPTARTKGALTIANSRQDLPQTVATREAFGEALVELGEINPNIVVLDAEVANSTYENGFQKVFPDRFFEMFIAEENMMGVAIGLSRIGYIPFVSTFAAFLTQTFDQIRMAQYSYANLKVVGSHCGVSIGQDGPSQMGLEDISMMRSILTSTIFYPGDSFSTSKLTKIMAKTPGIFYLRTTRGKTPVIYNENEKFEVGGFKLHLLAQASKVKKSIKSKVLVIAAGITLHEALKAQKEINIDVVDLYCIKPISQNLIKLIEEYKNIIVVEDHYPAGGIGDAVLSSLFQVNHPLGQLDQLGIKNFIHLCVHKIPMSGTPEELLHYEEIDAEAIISAVKKL